MSLDPTLRARIDELLSRDRVVLFMKGTRDAPRCGFSAAVVEILDGLLDQYTTVDVLADAELRDGIKQFSDWPTLPQLFVERELVGGTDIVWELAGTGELQQRLGVVETPVAPPRIEISPTAAAAISDALRDVPPEEGSLRFRIGRRWQYEMAVGPRQWGDVEVEAGGVRVLLDRATARRAEGTRIDYVSGPGGAGFKISNPGEPRPIRQLRPRELRELLDGGAVTLFDVRPAAERALASIAGAIPLEGDGEARLRALPKDAAIAFHCHHGMRSQAAAERFREEGWTHVANLAGGIDAWSAEVDPGVPRY